MKVTKHELEEWLKNDVTKTVLEAMKLESAQTKEDLTEYIDSSDLSPEDLHVSVLLSKATRVTYDQFLGDKTNTTFENMLTNHELLIIDEEDSND